jgi:Phosphate-selective porin O and P
MAIRKFLVSGLLLGTGMSVSAVRAQTAAAPAQPTVAQLEAQVQSLQAKVDALQADQSQADADRAAEIKQVLADADAQSELVSGYDPNVGFVLRSGDGMFSFHPGVVLDIREMTSYRSEIPAKGGGETDKTGYDTQSGFDLTRARFTADGNFGKQVTYFFQVDADQGSPVTLLDAYATYHFDNSPFAVKAGQFKDPLFHERNLSEANLLAVDRSLVEDLLGGGETSRVQGVSLMYDQDRLRAQLVIHDGYDSINTKFFDAGGIGAGSVGGGAGVTPTDYGVSGRGEYLAIGDRSAKFNPFSEYDGGFTALGDTQDILVLGGGYDYSQAGDNDVIFHTLDAQYDTTCGLSVYGAYLGTYRDLHSVQGATTGKPSVPAGNFYDPGALIQAAYLLNPRLEPFIRYDYTYLDGNSVSAFDLGKNTAQEFTVGANYYLYKQHVKFTVDGSWLPDGAPTDEDALGILEDSGHNEFVLRAQFQLAI